MIRLKLRQTGLICRHKAEILAPQALRTKGPQALDFGLERVGLHIPPILPTHLIQRMADLPQRMRLHRFHQRFKHIPPLAGGGL